MIYCHGNPTHGEDWLPFLRRGGAALAIDMPGWGRSERPDLSRFDYSMYGLSAFLERCLEELGIGTRRVHDWVSLAIWDHWDRGTARAILALYRHADPERLAEAGAELSWPTCPSLIIWGERDPYLPTRFAEDYAAALPNSELDLVPLAGHWPWINDRRVIDRVLKFVSAT